MTDNGKILDWGREVLLAEADVIRRLPLGESFCKAVQILLNCRSKVITTGMGKAGNIAQKVAGTLSSTGTPACFVHPGDAAHGDLGIIGAGDIILAFSNSGKTREVGELITLARHLTRETIIAITGRPESPIAQASDVIIDIGPIQEPCPLGLTPTASTSAMLAMGDALALVVMRERGFTRQDYGLRHHGGYLGMKARTPEGIESGGTEP